MSIKFLESVGYEFHGFIDPALPIFFQVDTMEKGTRKITKHFDLYDVVSSGEKKKMPQNNSSVSSGMYYHYHENIEIIYFIDGEAELLFAENKQVFHPGEIAVITPGTFHNIIPISEKVSYSYIIVGQNFLVSRRMDSNKYIFKSKIVDKDIVSYFEKLTESLIEYNNPLFDIKAMSFVTLICERIFTNYIEREIVNTLTSSHFSICIEVIKYISKHFRENIDLEAIANDIGVSRFHMCRCFKEHTASSIMDYVTVYKIERAKELIMTGAMNPTEAGKHCGFSSPSYFSKVFKKVTGVPPSSLKS